VAETQVHRIPAETPDAAAAAADYEQELRAFFQPPAGQFSRFDLLLLGMGPEGHTASLFPGSPALHERERWVAAPWLEKFQTYRITLTPPALNAAACVLFLIAGEEKAETLKAVLEGPSQPDLYPAQVIRPTAGELIWLVDEAAAGLLSTR
jgi:6-phosphogluconolactonase